MTKKENYLGHSDTAPNLKPIEWGSKEHLKSDVRLMRNGLLNTLGNSPLEIAYKNMCNFDNGKQ